MKNIKKSIKLATVVAALGMGVSSCSLDMLPLNDVVLENYWTDKSDVESVVSACYGGVLSSDYLSKIIAWGESRSDNTAVGPQCPDALKFLMKGSIKTTNEYSNWAPIYSVINRCNTVLYYAPQVAAKDPNYTESDLRITQAECRFLRAMSYFYLIKTFKDVPFTLEPTIDDNVEMRLGQTKFEVILDSLISDIEECKDYAPRKYENYQMSTGKVTRVAMYSLLAEMYLWKASDYRLSKADQNESYRKCIECCDWVLNYKNQLYRDNDIKGVDLEKYIDKNVLSQFGYPLLAEVSRSSSSTVPAAFNWIFNDGASFESVFEIASISGNTIVIMPQFHYMFGGSDNQNRDQCYMLAEGNLMPSYPQDAKFALTLFPVNTDYRTISSFSWEDATTFEINKYSSLSVSTSYEGKGSIKYNDKTQIPNHRSPSYDDQYHNYVFYRLSEIMLFRAEAEIEMAGNLDKMAAEQAGTTTPARSRKVSGASLATAEELYADALNLISAVYLRSNPAAVENKDAMPSSKVVKSFTDFETCLMFERQREFLFEGKRYFDLVRQARREGNTNKFIANLTNKYSDGGAAVAIKMRNMDFMYMPVLKGQMKVNPNLRQNSAYLDEETILNN